MPFAQQDYGVFRQFRFDLKVKTGISLFHLTPTLSYQGEGV
jgi:hypothetical protein